MTSGSAGHDPEQDVIRKIEGLGTVETPFSVTVSLKSSISLYRAINRWIEDANNGARGWYSVHFGEDSKYVTYRFSDSQTAFWFKMRWGGS